MFETYEAKSASTRAANVLLNDVRELYRRGKDVQAKLALYQAGTDPAFNSAIQALFVVAERQDLNNMLNEINTLVTHWEADHRAALGLPPI